MCCSEGMCSWSLIFECCGFRQWLGQRVAQKTRWLPAGCKSTHKEYLAKAIIILDRNPESLLFGYLDPDGNSDAG